MTSVIASALPELPIGSYILVRSEDTGVRRNGVLFKHAEGWGMPPGTSLPEPRFLTDGDVVTMTGSGSIELYFNPESHCEVCGGSGRTGTGSKCYTCTGSGLGERPWNLENFGRCASCGGTGGEYVPDWGITDSNCGSCEGSGWDDTITPDPLFVIWLETHGVPANG